MEETESYEPNDTFNDTLAYVLNGPIIMTIFLLGTFFNLFTVFILFKPKLLHKLTPQQSQKLLPTNKNNFQVQLEHEIVKKTYSGGSKLHKLPRIYIYFVCLIFCDTLLLASMFLNYSIPTLFNLFATVYARFIPIWYTCSYWTSTFNVWLMLTLIFERYRLLCRKLSDTVGHKPHDVYFKLTFILIASFLFTSLRFFELLVTYNTEYEEYMITQTDLGAHNTYKITYRIIGSLLFYSFVPYILIFVFSIKILLVITRSNQEHIKMHVNKFISTESDHILIALSVRFLVSRLPNSILDIIELLYYRDEGMDLHAGGAQSFANLCAHASNFLVVLSCALTFFTFYIFSKKFRDSVKNMFDKN